MWSKIKNMTITIIWLRNLEVLQFIRKGNKEVGSTEERNKKYNIYKIWNLNV